MIKCQTCGTENLDSSQFCDECGTMLNKQQADNKKTDFQPHIYEDPVFQPTNITSVGIPAVVDISNRENSSSECKRFSSQDIRATLVIERGDSIGTEFNISSVESNIGRWDADNGIFPDIDLDAYDPEAKISRRHARIIKKNGQYLIEDLGSTNGTYINRGRRLIPGTRQPLNDGDEIIVGKTFLRFYSNE